MAGIVDCSDFCRLCLVKEQVNNPIFEDDGRNRQVHTKISTCLPVKVTWEDALPKRICDGCNYKLDQQFQFWSTSVNSEKQLKQWLGIVDEEEPKPAVKTKKEKLETSASKRPRRNARRKAVQNIRQAVAAQQQSDSDDGEPLASLVDRDSDFDYNDTITKEETNSENDFPSNNTDSVEPTTFVNVTLDNEIGQAGPSGIQKPSVADTGETEAPEGNDIMENTTPTTGYESENIIIKEEDIFTLKHNGYNCNICCKTFFQRDLCRRHYLRMHVENSEHRCEVCGKSFKYKWNLITHSKLHDANRKKLTCSICSKQYATPQSLKMHQNRHLKRYAHKCTRCGKGFYQRAELKLHEDTEHNAVRYQCHVCKKTFCSKGYLTVHQRVHDPNYIAPELHCGFCGKTYRSRDLFRRHLKAHEGFACDVCGKTLTSQISLKNHLLIHRGERPLACATCGKRFNKRAILKVHMRTHTNERPYGCDICGKRFAQRSPLVIHMRYHTGERPYKCQHCVDAFVSNTCLKAHIKKCHQYYNL